MLSSSKRVPSVRFHRNNALKGSLDAYVNINMHESFCEGRANLMFAVDCVKAMAIKSNHSAVRTSLSPAIVHISSRVGTRSAVWRVGKQERRVATC